MSPEEQKEFEEMALMEEFEAQDSSEESMPEEETSMSKSLALGAVEGVPFAKDAAAAAETVLSTGLEDFGENFNRNKQDWDEAINKAEADNPVTFTVGDIASGFVLPAGRGLKGMMALGALSGLSRSEDRDIWDALGGAAIAGVGGKVVEGATWAINSGVRKLGDIIGVDRIANNTLKRAFGAVTAGNKRELHNHIRKTFAGEDLVEKSANFADYVMKKKIGKRALLEASDTPETLLTKLNSWQDDAGKKVGEFLKKNDRDLSSEEVLGVYKKLRSSTPIEDLLEEGSESSLKKAARLEEMLKDEFFERTYRYEKIKVPSSLDTNGNIIYTDKLEKVIDSENPLKMSLHSLNLKKRIFGEEVANFDKAMGTIDASKAAYFKKGYGALRESVEQLSGDIQGFNAVNKEYSTATTLRDLTKKVADLDNEDAIGLTQRMLNLRSTLFAASAVGGAVAGSPVVAASAAVLGAASIISKSDKAPAKLAFQLKKLSEKVKIDPDNKWSKRLVAQAALSSDDFRTALSSVFGEMNLIENAVARDSSDVLTKSDDILAALQYHSPQIANQLREAIDSEDTQTIGQIMDTISQDPVTKDFIQPGLGWDGKVFSPEDKDELIKQYRQQASGGAISFADSLKYIRQIELTGIIPQTKPKQEDYKEFIKRDKKSPRY